MYRLSKERGPWLTECDSDRRYGHSQGGEKRPLVVVVEPRGVRLRPKGCRAGEVFITWSTVYLRGQAAVAGYDTMPRGKGAGKRAATAALVGQLYLALTKTLEGDPEAKRIATVALLAAETSGLVKFKNRRAVQP
jgi:hypothetical protein